MQNTELDKLLAEQIAYYSARAAEYDATSGPLYATTQATLRAALEAFGPKGRVLELACGTGQWTQELAKTADELTAVDASEEMLALNRARVGRRDVRYQQVDLFEWVPDRRYDVVFFSAWLSHVPPVRLSDFWSRVGKALVENGRVFVIDELPAVEAIEDRIANAPAPAVRRRLRGGATYRAVKVLYEPAELERRLAELSWRLHATKVDWRVFYAIAARERHACKDGALARSAGAAVLSPQRQRGDQEGAER